MRNYSVEEIRASYAQKREWEKQFPVSYYIFRPLSFPLAALLSRLTNSAPLIAWSGLAVGLSASWLLLNLGIYGPWPGICGLALFALLDAADGNLARVTGTVTVYGKMLDGMLGKIAEGLYMPALACGLYLDAQSPGGFLRRLQAGNGETSWLVVVAGFIALCALLYSSLLETAFDYFKLQRAPAGPADVNAKIGSSRFRGNLFYAVFINLHAFNVQVCLLAAAALFGPRAMAVFAYSLAAYYLVRFAVTFCYYIRKASAELR